MLTILIIQWGKSIEQFPVRILSFIPTASSDIGFNLISDKEYHDGDLNINLII